jgi:hypothetical protein
VGQVAKAHGVGGKFAVPARIFAYAGTSLGMAGLSRLHQDGFNGAHSLKAFYDTGLQTIGHSMSSLAEGHVEDFFGNAKLSGKTQFLLKGTQFLANVLPVWGGGAAQAVCGKINCKLGQNNSKTGGT